MKTRPQNQSGRAARYALRTLPALALAAWLLASPAGRGLSAQQEGGTAAVASSMIKNWRPRTGTPAREAYAGPQVCVTCHAVEASGWQISQMARALKPVGQSKLLRQHPHLRFTRGPYHYRIDLEGDQAIYSVDDGKNVMRVPLLWQFGNGVVGQTFMFRLKGTYYETEVAYYPVLQRLDVVAGLAASELGSVRQAFALPLLPDTVRQCITCHTTAAATANQLHVESMIPGVTCEACHGPGARHVAAMRSLAAGAQPSQAFIFNPGKMAPDKVDGFCGACHRTTQHVLAEHLHGLDTIHYEPYRLEMSSCWIMTQRINCLTCHNPHQPLQRDLGVYDAACLACHANPKQANASNGNETCPVATQKCVTCHMPKCRIPLSPFSMSDHFIRIVRAGDICLKH